MTTLDRKTGIVARRAVGLALALLLGLAPTIAFAQSTGDAAKQGSDDSTRAWLSLGLGSGNSNVGNLAARAAASFAVNRFLAFTVEETSLGFSDRTVSSTNLLVGVQTPDPHQFFFLSAGAATTKCGDGCQGQSGIAVDAGGHIGGRHAGMSLVGFAVHTPGHNRCSCNSSNVNTSVSGIVLSVDVGWFVH